MELSSARPRMLIDRIMGGRGHLSNHEAIEAIRQIQPRDHVVLLHLSAQCNCPHLVRSLHEKIGHRFTVASPSEPTAWIELRGACTTVVKPRAVELLLFS
jgi:phosphoribosyl 1,2-cyclic phosphodiesterase